MATADILKALKEPFHANEIEWRIQSKGVKNGQPWAKVLAYVTNRAIMERLDAVLGFGWKSDFKSLDGAFLCTLSLKIDDEWISRSDGAQESQIEKTKGGISGAMKRAAVQFGIGRYLYKLPAGFATICSNGKYWVAADERKKIPSFNWNPPALPPWALPSGTQAEPVQPVKPVKPVDRGKPIPTQAEESFSLEKTIMIIKACGDMMQLKKVWSQYNSIGKKLLSDQDFATMEFEKDAQKHLLTEQQKGNN